MAKPAVQSLKTPTPSWPFVRPSRIWSPLLQGFGRALCVSDVLLGRTMLFLLAADMEDGMICSHPSMPRSMPGYLALRPLRQAPRGAKRAWLCLLDNLQRNLLPFLL